VTTVAEDEPPDPPEEPTESLAASESPGEPTESSAATDPPDLAAKATESSAATDPPDPVDEATESPAESTEPSEAADRRSGVVLVGLAAACLAVVPIDRWLSGYAQRAADAHVDRYCADSVSGRVYWPPGGWVVPMLFVVASVACLFAGLVRASGAKQRGDRPDLRLARLAWVVAAGALVSSILGFVVIYLAGSAFIPC
jgi:hypothetical protein